MAHVSTPPLPTPVDMSSTDPTQRRFRGAAKITDYTLLQEKLGEGTFGVVSKARSKRTGNVVALKKILIHNERDGFPITALREVKLLKMLSHPNVLKLEEMAVERQQGDEKGKGGKKRATLYMVMPYMDHDLSGMLTNPDIRFTEGQIKCYLLQLLEGLRYLHDSHILHRDMKAANLLISNRGLLQIADFGLARHYEGQTPQSGRGNGQAVREYTSLVVTRWYRPPELLLTLKKYTPAIDLWGVGCVFGEMFERKPILEGKSDLDQCHRIFQLVGSPTEENMPGWTELPGCEGNKDFEPRKGDIDKRFGPRIGSEGISLLKSLLCLDWRKRINAIDALQHEYFTTEPLPTRPEDIPRYDDSHELDARRRGHEKQLKLPPAPAGGTVGMGPDEWNGSGPPMNGHGYNGGDRAPRYDRGPRGPPRGFDDRGRGPPPTSEARPPPAWRQERDRARGGPPVSGANASNLPPRPSDLPPRPNDFPARPDVPSRGGPPPNGRGGGGGRGGGRDDVDTYIPSYSSANPNDRPPPRGDGGGRRGSRENAYRDVGPPPRGGPYEGGGRRGSRENAYRDPDAPPPGRGPYRDPDAPRPPTRESYRDGYREPRDGRGGGGGGGGGYGEQRRTRSRSPERYRDPHRDRERDREREDAVRRERLQNREREMYRR